MRKVYAQHLHRAHPKQARVLLDRVRLRHAFPKQDFDSVMQKLIQRRARAAAPGPLLLVSTLSPHIAVPAVEHDTAAGPASEQETSIPVPSKPSPDSGKDEKSDSEGDEQRAAICVRTSSKRKRRASLPEQPSLDAVHTDEFSSESLLSTLPATARRNRSHVWRSPPALPALTMGPAPPTKAASPPRSTPLPPSPEQPSLAAVRTDELSSESLLSTPPRKNRTYVWYPPPAPPALPIDPPASPAKDATPPRSAPLPPSPDDDTMSYAFMQSPESDADSNSAKPRVRKTASEFLAGAECARELFSKWLASTI